MLSGVMLQNVSLYQFSSLEHVLKSTLTVFYSGQTRLGEAQWVD